MAEQEQPTGDVSRIVFRQILDGDRRKFIAQSNDSDTGGGARDLRFRSWDQLEAPLRQLFPTQRTENRRRGGSNTLTVHVGRLHWQRADGTETSKEAVLEPPTDARPGEARVTRVHEYACFTIAAPAKGTGRLLALFIQRHDGTVWPFVITERSLEHDDWHPAVSEFLLSALNAKRPEKNAAYGYIDFTTGQKFIR